MPAGGPLKHSGDLHAWLKHLGVTEATGQDLAELLQATIGVADTSHLVPPAPVPVAGVRLDLTPAAGLYTAFEISATAPSKGFWLLFLDCDNSDFRLRTTAVTGITASRVEIAAAWAPGGQGNLIFARGTSPVQVGSADWLTLSATDEFPTPFFFPAGMIFGIHDRSPAVRGTIDVIAQEVP